MIPTSNCKVFKYESTTENVRKKIYINTPSFLTNYHSNKLVNTLFEYVDFNFKCIFILQCIIFSP